MRKSQPNMDSRKSSIISMFFGRGSKTSRSFGRYLISTKAAEQFTMHAIGAGRRPRRELSKMQGGVQRLRFRRPRSERLEEIAKFAEAWRDQLG